ncbi:unnamed protein product [Pedinophyceae sp. YPF-701]|nr:unnamed protein product [Pedinophyceae sp. YPF-701]
MDDKSLSLLRRKLKSLSYSDVFEETSAPLVGRLLEDLVHTTESYRSLKLRSAQQTQENGEWQSKTEALRRDMERVVGENNRLHSNLLELTDELAKRDRREFEIKRSLNVEISTLKYVNRTQQQRVRQLEAEVSGLQDLINTAGAGNENQPPVVGKIDLPFEPAAPHEALKSSPPEAQAVLKQWQERVDTLEAHLRQSRATASGLRSQIVEAQEKAILQDAELERLRTAVSKERDLDQLALQYRNESSERLVASLNQQIDFLTEQVSKLEAQLGPRNKALDAAEAAKVEVEGKLRAASRENERIRSEMYELQAVVQTLQASYEKEAALRPAGPRVGVSGAEKAKSFDTSEIPPPAAGPDAHPDLLEQLRTLQSVRLEGVAALKASEEERRRLEAEIRSASSRAAEAEREAERLMQDLEQARQEAGEPVPPSRPAQDASVDRSFLGNERMAELEAELHSQVARNQALEEQLRTAREGQVIPNSASAPAADTTAASERATILARQDAEQLREQVLQLSAAQARAEGMIQELTAQLGERAEELAVAEEKLGALSAQLEVAREAAQGAPQPAQPDTQAQPIAQAAAGDASSAEAVRDELRRSAMQAEQLRARCDSLESQLGKSQLQLNDARERLGRSEAEFERLSADLVAAKQRAEAAEAAQSAAEGQSAHLKTLVSQVDSTREELLERLHQADVKLHAARVEADRWKADLKSCKAELEAREADFKDLQQTSRDLDTERDRLQTQIDSCEEELEILRSQKAAALDELASCQSRVAEMESSLAAANSLSASLEAENKSVVERSTSLEGTVAALQREQEALREEVQSLMEDLQGATQESQALGAELVQVSRERDSARAAEAAAAHRADVSDKMAKAKERQLDDLVSCYQELAGDNRRLSSAVAQLEKDLRKRDLEIEAAKKEQEGLRAALRSAQLESSQLVGDLQGFEHNVADISQELRRAEERAAAAEAAHERVSSDLHEARGVQLHLEQIRQGMQREIAALETHCSVLQARLVDAARDIDALEHRQAMEVSRCKELEALLADARARGLQPTALNQEAAGRIAVLEERIKMMDERNMRLEQQLLDQASMPTHPAPAALESGSPVQGDAGSALVVQPDTEAQEPAAPAAEGGTVWHELERVQAELRSRTQDLQRTEHTVSQERKARSRLEAQIASLEEDRKALQQDNASLLREIASLGQAKGEGGATGQDPANVVLAAKEELERKLEEEKALRVQAETDFQALLDSVEQGASPPAAPASGQSGARRGRINARELQRRLQKLEDENKRLIGLVAEAEKAVGTVVQEAGRAREGYSSAESSLGEAAAVLDSSIGDTPPRS